MSLKGNVEMFRTVRESMTFGEVVFFFLKWYPVLVAGFGLRRIDLLQVRWGSHVVKSTTLR